MEQLVSVLTETLVVSIQLGLPLVLLFVTGYIISVRDQNAENA